MARRRNTISGLAKLLERVPADAFEDLSVGVQDAATTAAANAGRTSISFGSAKSYPLEANILKAKARNSKRTSTIRYPLTPAGAWVWLDEGISPHQIRPKRRQTRTGRPPALKFSGRYVHVRSGGELGVRHPGVRGVGVLAELTDDVGAMAVDVLQDTALKVVNNG